MTLDPTDSQVMMRTAERQIFKTDLRQANFAKEPSVRRIDSQKPLRRPNSDYPNEIIPQAHHPERTRNNLQGRVRPFDHKEELNYSVQATNPDVHLVEDLERRRRAPRTSYSDVAIAAPSLFQASAGEHSLGSKTTMRFRNETEKRPNIILTLVEGLTGAFKGYKNTRRSASLSRAVPTESVTQVTRKVPNYTRRMKDDTVRTNRKLPVERHKINAPAPSLGDAVDSNEDFVASTAQRVQTHQNLEKQNASNPELPTNKKTSKIKLLSSEDISRGESLVRFG